MTSLTLTRTDLFNLSDLHKYCSPSAAHDLTYGRPSLSEFLTRPYLDHRGVAGHLHMMWQVDNNERESTSTRYPWILQSAAIYNEAVIENAHHDALISNAFTDAMSAPDPVESRQAQHTALVNMRRRETEVLLGLEQRDRQIAEMRDQIQRLQRPITSGDDARLEEFWVLAGEEATSQGFCPEYDRIAEAMGGQRRRADYSVSLSVNVRVTVSLSSITRGESIDMETVRSQLDLSDIESAIDLRWSDVEVDDYDEE